MMKRIKNKKEFVYYMLSLAAVCGMLALIFCFSAAPAIESSDLSGGICEKMVTGFVRTFNLSWEKTRIMKAAEFIETPVRKCAHFMEYALLGMLFRIHQDSLKIWGYRTKLWHGLLFCALYALSDEIHQFFVSGRACRIMDVGIDTSGAAFGILLIELFVFHFLKKRLSKVG